MVEAQAICRMALALRQALPLRLARQPDALPLRNQIKWRLVLDFRTSPVFGKNYNSTKKITMNRGGSRSTKTYSLCQMAILWLLTGRVTATMTVPSGVWSIVRKHSTTLSKTVQRDFEEILTTHGLWQFIKFNKTTKTYTLGDRMVEMMGADDPQKLRGAKRAILHCNEANELNYDQEFLQLMMRTTHKVFIDFNPDNPYSWLNVEMEQKRAVNKGDVELIVSTYRDNPFLEPAIVDEIEALKYTNPTAYEVYGQGAYGKIEGLVFETWEQIEELPDGAELLGYGLDFGFTQDPTAVVALYRWDGGVLFDEVLYSRGLTNPDIAERLRHIERKPLICDSAEPKSIEELRRNGIRQAVPAKKGKDSVRAGLDLMRSYKIRVTANSINLIRELRTYSYTVNREGGFLNEPQDKNNHIIDAARYISLRMLPRKSTSSISITRL